MQKTVLNPDERNGKYKIMAIAFGLLAAFLLLREFSPDTPVLCVVFNNCPQDREDRNEVKSNEDVIYDEAVKEAQSAISNNPKNIDDLKNDRYRLQKAIAELEIIQPDAAIYQEARKDLESYGEELNKMSERLKVERNVEKQLAQLEAVADEATRQTLAARDICELHTTLNLWKELQQKLREISPNTFLAEQAQRLSSECEGRVQQVKNRINELIKEEERQWGPGLQRPGGYPDFC